jgi:ribosomal protein L3 glutamine methyltransferase
MNDNSGLCFKRPVAPAPPIDCRFMTPSTDLSTPIAGVSLTHYLEQATERLAQSGVHFGHGTDNAHDEAAWLVLWGLGLPLDTDTTEHPNPLTPEQCQRLDTLIAERIATRRPAAYITQEAWLQGVSFYVDERCIVPRSFIAELIAEGTLDLWLSERTERVLDLCTGNGSLAVLAALAWPQVQVTGADLSADALAVARINGERHGLSPRIDWRESNVWSGCPGPWDLVLCNPPYVNSRSMAELPAEFRAEPELALAGGEDGMDFIRQLLAQAPQHLSADGVLVLEIGHEREHFEAAFPHLQPVWLSTSAGDDHVLLLTADALGVRA